MHFSQRAYLLIMLTTVLAVAGIWSADPGFTDLWRIPAALLYNPTFMLGFPLHVPCHGEFFGLFSILPLKIKGLAKTHR